MFTRKELDELIHSEPQDEKVLSLYFTTDLTQHLKEERRLALKKLLDGLGEDARDDVERVQRFFDQEFDWQSLGIAIFSSRAADYWRVIRLAVPVPEVAIFEMKPNVRLLADLLDEYECFGVALVNREHARFFSIQMGEIREVSHDFPPTPGRQKQGGESAARFQRHADGLALQNLKQAARLTSEFAKSSECARLLIAGTEDVLGQFRELLPKSTQKNIVGEFAMDIHAPAHAVLEKANEIVKQVQREQEVETVETLVTLAQKKRASAALGLDNTLNALLEGKVNTLVLASDYHEQGFACGNCGYLSAQAIAKCPLCGSPMCQEERMVDLAVRKAIGLKSRIQVVYDDAATRLKQVGGIGAILRF